MTRTPQGRRVARILIAAAVYVLVCWLFVSAVLSWMGLR